MNKTLKRVKGKDGYFYRITKYRFNPQLYLVQDNTMGRYTNYSERPMTWADAEKTLEQKKAE